MAFLGSPAAAAAVGLTVFRGAVFAAIDAFETSGWSLNERAFWIGEVRRWAVAAELTWREEIGRDPGLDPIQAAVSALSGLASLLAEARAVAAKKDN